MYDLVKELRDLHEDLEVLLSVQSDYSRGTAEYDAVAEYIIADAKEILRVEKLIHKS